MGRYILLTTLFTIAFFAHPAGAQTAFRCDLNGQTVYSDKPCPPGNAAKAVAPTQETAEQKAASDAANARMRQDNAELNKRLTEREKLEAKERADARKAAPKERADAKEKQAKAKRAKKAKAAKAKAPKTVKKAKKSGNSAVTRP
jgi:hypothetical protein